MPAPAVHRQALPAGSGPDDRRRLRGADDRRRRQAGHGASRTPTTTPRAAQVAGSACFRRSRAVSFAELHGGERRSWEQTARCRWPVLHHWSQLSAVVLPALPCAVRRGCLAPAYPLCPSLHAHRRVSGCRSGAHRREQNPCARSRGRITAARLELCWCVSSRGACFASCVSTHRAGNCTSGSRRAW